MRTQWSGCGTALVTPFTETGAIDESAVTRLARRHGGDMQEMRSSYAVDHKQIEEIGQTQAHRLLRLIAKIHEDWPRQIRNMQPFLDDPPELDVAQSEPVPPRLLILVDEPKRDE